MATYKALLLCIVVVLCFACLSAGTRFVAKNHLANHSIDNPPITAATCSSHRKCDECRKDGKCAWCDKTKKCLDLVTTTVNGANVSYVNGSCPSGWCTGSKGCDCGSSGESIECPNFWPCSDSVIGLLILMAFYGLVLAGGAKLISEGSELLLEVRLRLKGHFLLCSTAYTHLIFSFRSDFGSWCNRRAFAPCAWCPSRLCYCCCFGCFWLYKRSTNPSGM